MSAIFWVCLCLYYSNAFEQSNALKSCIRIYMIDPSMHLTMTSIQNQDNKSGNRVLIQTRIPSHSWPFWLSKRFPSLVIHLCAGLDPMVLSRKMGGYPNLTGYQLILRTNCCQLMGRKNGDTKSGGYPN